jgi:hypothetical protein
MEDIMPLVVGGVGPGWPIVIAFGWAAAPQRREDQVSAGARQLDQQGRGG